MAEGGIGGSNWAPAAWLVGERLLPAAAALTPTGATRAGSHQLASVTPSVPLRPTTVAKRQRGSFKAAGHHGARDCLKGP